MVTSGTPTEAVSLELRRRAEPLDKPTMADRPVDGSCPCPSILGFPTDHNPAPACIQRSL